MSHVKKKKKCTPCVERRRRLAAASMFDNLAELRRVATMLASEVEASTGLAWAGAASLTTEECPLRLIKAVKELRKVLGLEL